MPNGNLAEIIPESVNHVVMLLGPPRFLVNIIELHHQYLPTELLVVDVQSEAK